MRAGWLNAIPGFSIVCGQVLSGALTASIGKAKFQCMTVLSVGGAFLAGECHLMFRFGDWTVSSAPGGFESSAISGLWN